MKHSFFSLVLTIAVALVTIRASAITINVANPSFENIDLGTDGGFVDGNVTGWTDIPFAGFYNGLQNPQDAQYTDTTGLFSTIPGGTGDQFAFTQNTGAI